MAWMNKWNANSFLFGLLRFIHTCYFSVFFALTMNDEQHVATCASGPNCPREHVCERAHARCTWTRINGSHLAPDGFGRVSSLALAAVVPLHSAATWEFPRTICLLTPCFTFTPRTWKCGFLVLMGMWGNRKICIFLSMLLEPKASSVFICNSSVLWIPFMANYKLNYWKDIVCCMKSVKQ